MKWNVPTWRSLLRLANHPRHRASPNTKNLSGRSLNRPLSKLRLVHPTPLILDMNLRLDIRMLANALLLLFSISMGI